MFISHYIPYTSRALWWDVSLHALKPVFKGFYKRLIFRGRFQRESIKCRSKLWLFSAQNKSFLHVCILKTVLLSFDNTQNHILWSVPPPPQFSRQMGDVENWILIRKTQRSLPKNEKKRSEITDMCLTLLQNNYAINNLWQKRGGFVVKTSF